MAPEIFAGLRECDGREVSLTGGTRLRSQLQRPEIIIPNTQRPETRGGQPVNVQVGTRVRLTEPRWLGVVGQVIQPPMLRPSGDSILREMVEIQLDSGERQRLPLTNIEVLM
jgi:hypothetical protein